MKNACYKSYTLRKTLESVQKSNVTEMKQIIEERLLLKYQFSLYVKKKNTLEE